MRGLSWLKRLWTHPNPIFLKELYTTTRGRAYGYGFNLAMLLLATAFVLVLGTAQSRVDRLDAWSLMPLLGVALMATCWLFVPLLTFLSVATDRDDGTLEFLSITALGPAAIVRGKLYAALIHLATFYCALTPFMVLCFLLPGLDFRVLAAILIVTFMGSLFFTSLSLAAGLQLNKGGGAPPASEP